LPVKHAGFARERRKKREKKERTRRTTALPACGFIQDAYERSTVHYAARGWLLPSLSVVAHSVLPSSFFSGNDMRQSATCGIPPRHCEPGRWDFRASAADGCRTWWFVLRDDCCCGLALHSSAGVALTRTRRIRTTTTFRTTTLRDTADLPFR